MIRAFGAAMALSGLLVKVAVGLVALFWLVEAMVPSSPREERPSTMAGGTADPACTVVLSVPEGRPAGNLVVVDASGRELATLTHWANGRTAVITRHHAGPTVAYHRSDSGAVNLLVTGSAVETHMQVGADGMTKTAAIGEPSRFINPPPSRGRGPVPGPGRAPIGEAGPQAP